MSLNQNLILIGRPISRWLAESSVIVQPLIAKMWSTITMIYKYLLFILYKKKLPFISQFL